MPKYEKMKKKKTDAFLTNTDLYVTLMYQCLFKCINM